MQLWRAEPSAVNKVSAALFRLDDRVLHISEQKAKLRTPEGWTRMASRWWVFLAVALLMALSVTLSALGGNDSWALQELPFIGWFCYRAGRLKSEWERTQGTGYFEEHRPPGI